MTRTPESSCVTPENFTPVVKLILRRRKARSSCLDSASSSSGTSRGSASTMCTSAPKDFHTLANSTPMTLPPMITARCGTHSRLSAWSLVTTRPSMVRPGSVRAYEPVARTTLRPLTARSPTWTVSAATSRPWPSNELDLVGLHQALQPLVQPLDDAALYALTPAMSMPSQ